MEIIFDLATGGLTLKHGAAAMQWEVRELRTQGDRVTVRAGEGDLAVELEVVVPPALRGHLAGLATMAAAPEQLALLKRIRPHLDDVEDEAWDRSAIDQVVAIRDDIDALLARLEPPGT